MLIRTTHSCRVCSSFFSPVKHPDYPSRWTLKHSKNNWKPSWKNCRSFSRRFISFPSILFLFRKRFLNISRLFSKQAWGKGEKSESTTEKVWWHSYRESPPTESSAWKGDFAFCCYSSVCIRNYTSIGTLNIPFPIRTCSSLKSKCLLKHSITISSSSWALLPSLCSLVHTL